MARIFSIPQLLGSWLGFQKRVPWEWRNDHKWLKYLGSLQVVHQPRQRDSLQAHTLPRGHETWIDGLASNFVVLQHNQEQAHGYGGLALLTHLQLPVSTFNFHLGSSINFWESGPIQHILLFVCLCNYGQLLPVRAAGSWILSKVLSWLWVFRFLPALPQHLKFILCFLQ